MPFKRVSERGKWIITEFFAVPSGENDLSLINLINGGIQLELVYGDRANPQWRYGKRLGSSGRRLRGHCTLLMDLNPSVDVMIKALEAYLSSLPKDPE